MRKRLMPVALLAGLVVAGLTWTTPSSGIPWKGSPPPVHDFAGRPLQVGSVVAQLTPAPGGGCSGFVGVVSEGSEAQRAPDVAVSILEDCSAVVTAIDYPPASAPDSGPPQDGGQFVEPQPAPSG